MDMVVLYICFGICFVCFAIRTSYHVLKNRGSELAESSRFTRALFVVMFLLWSSWVGMVLGDPYEMSVPEWLRYVGLAAFIIGVAFFIVAHANVMGGETQAQGFATRGLYSKLRHPMYYGFILLSLIHI